MTWTPQLIRYKKLIKNENYFREIATFIKDSLTDEQLSKLILHDKGETYNLWEQIFLRFIDNRYSLFFQKSEAFGRAEIFLEKYTFLLNSDLDDHRVRHIFIRALMEVISIGSGMFWSSRDAYVLIWQNDARMHLLEKEKMFRLWKIFAKEFRNICTTIERIYPNISKIKMPCYEDWESYKQWHEKEFTFAHQLSVGYAYAFRKLLKKKKISVEGFEQEFFGRTRWYFECLNQCNDIFANKYKEEIIRELSSALGMDTDRAYLVRYSFLRDPEDTQYKNKSDLSEFISSLFTEEELKMLELRDLQGNSWTFGEQIKYRYYSKYPSFVSIQEIEENIKQKVEEFRPLLNEETAEVIRDILFDEIERECFVSRTTYFWNQEMTENLKNSNFKCNEQVTKSIDLLISLLPAEAVKQLSLEINGRIFSLREQLMSRWRRAWFGASPNDFQEYLSRMHFYTPYNFESWRSKEVVSRGELQAFLEEIDMFFLYPQRWRIIKKLLFRLDNGRVIAFFKNRERVRLAQVYAEVFLVIFSKLRWITLACIVLIGLISCCIEYA